MTLDKNKPAWRLLDRSGFRQEGHFLESAWFEGEWVGELQYAQLQKEWVISHSGGSQGARNNLRGSG